MQKRSRDSYDRLVAAGMSAAEEEGFAGTSIQSICRRAGLTTGAFYARFDSKDALGTAFASVLAGEVEAVIEGFEISAQEDRPLQAVRQLLRDSVQTYERRAGLLRTTLELAGRNSDVARSLRSLNDRSLRRIVGAVRQHLVDGGGGPSDAAILVAFMSAMTTLREAVLGARLFEETPGLPTDLLVDQLTVMVARHLEIPGV